MKDIVVLAWDGRITRAARVDRRGTVTTLACPVADAEVNGKRVVVLLPRSLVLVWPKKPGETTALPADYQNAWHAIIQREGAPADVFLSRARWVRWKNETAIAPFRWLGAAYLDVPNNDESFQAAAAAVVSPEFPWLVPPPELGWKAWSPERRERVLATAATFLLLSGTLARGAASRSGEALTRARQESRRMERASAAASADVVSLLEKMAAGFPARAHLVEFSYDASAHRARLRGRAADLRVVSEVEKVAASLPGVAKCRTDRAVMVNLGGASVAEFSSELDLQ